MKAHLKERFMDKESEDKILSIETIEDVKEHYRLLSQGITPSVVQLIYNHFASEDKRVDENTEDTIEFVKLLDWFENCYYMIGYSLKVFTEEEIKEVMEKENVRHDVDGEMSIPIDESFDVENEPLSPEQELKQDKI